MGVLDAPPQKTVGHPAALLQRMRVGLEDATLAVLGDSTGNETFEWVYLLAQWLGTLFPSYTVLYYLWSDGSQNYAAPVTIQTGTGARTLSVYNGSTSGQNTVYSTTRIPLQIPVAPQLVIINYGYNEGSITDTFRGILYNLTRLVADSFPAAGLMLIGQPPANVSYVAINRDMAIARARVTAALAATERYGFINVLQAFLDNPTHETDWIGGDGLHPNAAGQLVWLGVIKRQFLGAVDALPEAPSITPHRLWVPATAFLAAEGTPTLAAVGPATGMFPAWSMPDGATSALVAAVDYPDAWGAVNAYAITHTASGSGFTSANNVIRLGIALARFPKTSGLPWDSPATQTSLGVRNAFVEVLTNGAAFNSGAWHGSVTKIAASSLGTFTYRPLGLRLRRYGADALDTLAEAAYLSGVMLERAG